MFPFKTDLDNLKGYASYVMLFDGDIEHVREKQPCMGELRKYESTHKGECTQPKNSKPGDLHWPFPEGTPSGLYLNLNGMYRSFNEYKNSLIEFMFSSDSPWYSGFKCGVEFQKNNQGKILGVYIPHGDFDPTVFVNLCKHTGMILGNEEKVNQYHLLVANGLNEREALAICCINPYPIYRGVWNSDTYTCPKTFSFRRFLDANPKDLTGGLWSHRVDYNRTDMGEPFTSDGKTLPWADAFVKKGIPRYSYSGGTVFNTKKEAGRLKEVINELYSEEPVPEDKMYIWTTTSGRTNAAA